MTEVILVNANDVEKGAIDKLEAHKKGLLHRAISVCVFHPDGHVMLQKRAAGKYHSAGLWSNTCCSHPKPGEVTHAAALRRLKEEMGIVCELSEIGTFIYRTEFHNGLIEHELDHVFMGISDSQPSPDPNEVEDWKWMDITKLQKDISENSHAYAYWFSRALELALKTRM